MKKTRNRVRLTESQLHDVIKESVRKVIKESSDLNLQEHLYVVICNLENDIRTIVSNTDSSSNQAFGGPEEKLRAISNSLSHVDEGLANQSISTFNKLQEVISELGDLRISLKTLDSKDNYYGHPFKTPNGTVGLSNYR